VYTYRLQSSVSNELSIGLLYVQSWGTGSIRRCDFFFLALE
jgi:hypothetical protein